ncbi:hypothetical protein [Moorena producens]|uniref:hypothetical protein n=1 Tax=Moorena producens TaxID=1155739 RepID=UPI0011EA68F7|nr:hypothetical protein [Moorena producens]
MRYTIFFTSCLLPLACMPLGPSHFCCLTWWCVTGWTVPILANAKIRASPSLTHPTEHFQI